MGRYRYRCWYSQQRNRLKGKTCQSIFFYKVWTKDTGIVNKLSFCLTFGITITIINFHKYNRRFYFIFK